MAEDRIMPNCFDNRPVFVIIELLHEHGIKESDHAG